MIHMSLLCFATFLLLSHAPFVPAGPILRRCYDAAGNYTSDSQFETNLRDTLLPSIATNAPLNLSTYSYSSAGRAPDRVFGFAQCLQASTAQACADCLNQSVEVITRLCPNSNQAVVRYDDCFLRYSDQTFLSQKDVSFWEFIMNGANVTEPALFSRQLGELMRNLSRISAQSPSRLAGGSTGYIDFSSIYGMAQCNGDLSSVDCLSCIEQAMGFINNKVGARVYSPSCNIRYETYSFYPAFGLAPPPPPPPSPPPPTSPPPPPDLPSVAAPPPPPREATSSATNPGDNNNSRRSIIIGVAGSVATAIVIVIVVYIWLVTRKNHGRVVAGSSRQDSIEHPKPLLFDLNELRAATDNFAVANKLGQGGFGPVYKGKLSDGHEIAVKRLLASSSQGITELRNEVVSLAKLQHRNLVKLLGCCLEEREKLLIYEFVPNSSLEKFLFDPAKRNLLKWEFRHKIVEGIARGLLYLHEDSRLRIIHRDLKASNILLDAEMTAKISDFGLAKIFEADQTQGNTSRIAGTFGYMAPEYAMRGLFSTKSDVYGFGVLVLEIVTGKNNTNFSEFGEALDLLNYVWKHWTNGNISQLMDGSLGENCPRDQVLRCMHIGLLCVQEDPLERPTMSNVVLMLSSNATTIAAPSPPPFCVLRGNANSSSSRSGQSENPRDTSISQSSHRNGAPESVNDASITDLCPR